MDLLRNYDPSDKDRIATAHGRVLTAWDDYTISLAVVRMQGPARLINEAADELRIWMRDFDRSASALYRDDGDPKHRDYSGFDVYMGSFRDVSQKFEQAAQAVLDSHD